MLKAELNEAWSATLEEFDRLRKEHPPNREQLRAVVKRMGELLEVVPTDISRKPRTEKRT